RASQRGDRDDEKVLRAGRRDHLGSIDAQGVRYAPDFRSRRTLEDHGSRDRNLRCRQVADPDRRVHEKLGLDRGSAGDFGVHYRRVHAHGRSGPEAQGVRQQQQLTVCPMSDGRSAAFRLAVGAATFAALALLWYGATSITHVIPPVYFPTPAEVVRALQQITIRGYADGRLHEHFFHSFLLVLMGFAAAVAVGVPLGMLMGWSRRTEALINPAFLLLRPIPPLAWIPLA